MARILLVDDDNSVLNLLMGILKQEGLVTVPTSSGEEALKALAVTSINLVITDFDMPRMNGEKLIEKIKEKILGMPIIMITENRPEQTKADAVLDKPISTTLLRMQIKRLLSK